MDAWALVVTWLAGGIALVIRECEWSRGSKVVCGRRSGVVEGVTVAPSTDVKSGEPVGG